MTELTIRPITELHEIDAVEHLQRAVWGITDDRALVPSHVLITAQHHGGVLIGAFTPDDEMVGFIFGFIGSTSDERAQWMGSPYLHCSHQLGVLPEYRRQKLGLQLKCAQREALIAQNLKLAVWTVDPLLAGNMALNIQSLGGIVRCYHPNLYGELREALNAGLPTDRFEVEWWLTSDRVTRHLSDPDGRASIASWRKAGAMPLNHTSARADHLRTPDGWQPQPDHAHLLVEVPADFQSMRQIDLDLAYRWRMHIREIFTWAFNEKQPYALAWVGMEDHRSYYVLSRTLDLHAIAGKP